MRRAFFRFTSMVLVVAWLLPGAAFGQEAAAFSKEQLDQFLAPVALYPDSLLSQVLMASTYPADVAEAAKWSKANPKLTGDEAVKAVESQQWDPSVQSLAAFPQVLATMDTKPDWVQNLGDAFLAQPEDVMDSVQRLRQQAYKAGNLKDSKEQKVVIQEAPPPSQTVVVQQSAPPPQVIVIEPAQPQVVYVPAYNPTVVYGPWMYPAYPPVYIPPPPGYGFVSGMMTGIGFGIGVGITNALWGGFDWGRHDVDINVNRYNNVNVNRQLNVNQNKVNWKHNEVNRRGVPYRDTKTRQQYDKRVAGADGRKDYRGRDADRDKARTAMQDRQKAPDRSAGGTRERAGEAREVRKETGKSGGTGAARDRAASASATRERPSTTKAAPSGSRDSALKGVDNAKSRQEVSRGQSSQRSMQKQSPPARGGDRKGGGGGPKGGGKGKKG